ncbi:MAG TPA: outer membrane protein assembly factor BamD [Candidatus Eisenbacteria bacterium]|nr:outer membrane protein assembly factor BamD [Candidatus Eisenbacteria bacterium]
MSRSRLLLLLLLASSLLVAGCGGTLKEQTGGIADYERGKKAYDQANWADAALDLKAFVEAYPGTERTDDALYYLGDAYFKMKDYALASGQFDRLLRDFPASVYEADARFYLARCDDLQSHGAMLDQTETERAITRYREFLGAHPDHPRAAEATARVAALRDRLAEKRFKSGRLYTRLREYDAAERYFRIVIAEYPESRWAADAALLLVETLVKRGRRDEAIETLRSVPPGLARPETQRKLDAQRRLLENGTASK